MKFDSLIRIRDHPLESAQRRNEKLISQDDPVPSVHTQ